MIETIQVGDLVMTADGTFMQVRWVGRSVIASQFADPERTRPIRIKAGALDENVPARDLLLSPGHAVLVGDVLAHAAALVNGTSIRQETAVPEIFSYFHIELDTHALLLAEGVAAESFLDGAEGLVFANIAGRVPPQNCQELPYPRARSMRQLPLSVRSRLAARAAMSAAESADVAA